MGNCVGLMLRDSKIITEALGGHYDKTSSYYSDRLIDIFINGYERWDDVVGNSENNKSRFIKDPFGGYFAPIFGNNRLTKRIDNTSYKFFNEQVAKNLLKGNALGLLFLTSTTTL